MATHFIRGKYREEDRIIGPALDALDAAYDFLLALPHQDSARFFRLDTHLHAFSTGDHNEACLHLFWDTYNWLKFFFYTTAFKARQIAAELVESYNRENHLAWMILGRASLEYGAVGHYFLAKMNRLDLAGPHFRISQLQQFEELMLQYAHGTRFDWRALMAGEIRRPQASSDTKQSERAVNVLTALKHLARRDERYCDVRDAYEMLSDFAHPNMASHATVADLPQALGEMHECRLAVAPGALRGEFLAVISLPWISKGLGAMVEVLQGTAPLLGTWLTHLDNKVTITVDMTT